MDRAQPNLSSNRTGLEPSLPSQSRSTLATTTGRQMSKSPSLVFNASRMARMVGGLTSVMTQNKDGRRVLKNSKSGNDIRRPAAAAQQSTIAAVAAKPEPKSIQIESQVNTSVSIQDKTLDSINSVSRSIQSQVLHQHFPNSNPKA